jgi:hypothetical protein
MFMQPVCKLKAILHTRYSISEAPRVGLQVSCAAQTKGVWVPGKQIGMLAAGAKGICWHQNWGGRR